MHIQTFTLFVIKFYLSRNTSLLNTSLKEDERFHSPIETEDPEERERGKTRGRREKQERGGKGRVAKICDILVFSAFNVGSILSLSLSEILQGFLTVMTHSMAGCTSHSFS